MQVHGQVKFERKPQPKNIVDNIIIDPNNTTPLKEP
jgi:hypothetical protein